MLQQPAYKIYQTSDPDLFSVGANMMATSDPWITLSMNYENCLAAFTDTFKEVYILEIDNSIAGFIILQVFGAFSGYIQTVCVEEKYRNHGWGKKLIRFAEDRILQSSPNMFICVSAFNEGAAKLYYSLGFEKIGVLKDFIKVGFDELLLRKTMGPRLGYAKNKNS